MKDTVRIIMFLECNFKCSYCCNEKEKFSSQFVEMYFSQIDFSKYSAVCISGGEPFFRKNEMYEVLDRIPRELPIFLYTNGFLITDQDLLLLRKYNIKCVNIGVHGVNQPKFINKDLERFLPVRWQAQDKNREKLLAMYPERITEENSKFWKMDDCERINEDWILLKDYE